MRGGRRVLVVAIGLSLLGVGGAGCQHGHFHQVASHDLGAGVMVPPPGAVPRELDKITLPPYVIEAPDQLLIEVVWQGTVPDDKGQSQRVTRGLPVQPVSGPFQVRLDGSVSLGYWGSVPVSGLTLEQAAQAIRETIIKHPGLQDPATKPESIIVITDVLAYNSKRYYIIFDGGGFAAGEQVLSFPITGSETVLDAMSNVAGLPDVASKRNIWVARRTPHPGQPWQILPVDWVGMTQHGITTTNYQVMPGDRIYVKAQKLVTVERTLARVLAPIERMFGVTLLGANTVNQISGRGSGFGSGNQ